MLKCCLEGDRMSGDRRQVQNRNISRGPAVLDPADSTSNLGRPRLCRPDRVRERRRARLATDLRDLTSQPAHLTNSVRNYCAAVLSREDRRKPRLDALLGHKAVPSQTRVTSEILHGDAGSVHRGRNGASGHSWLDPADAPFVRLGRIAVKWDRSPHFRLWLEADLSRTQVRPLNFDILTTV